ncbi:ImmA/IrrE family metallo-endopeptidase [Candidatus Marsarchaeota archaeon]|nr:ImmA/IrrE family metallo-endopeptidase [Candidatus Marsarchaeota archaeon]MCL5404987.1 ImmA/IrrE family metallo-endopeptidase [Candidatus Marsarchaeota archaeon]
MRSSINAKLEDYSAEFSGLMRYAKDSIDSFSRAPEGTLRLRLWSGEKDFRVMHEPLKGDGYIVNFSGRPVIFVSTRLDSSDEKMVLAHEAAHLLRMDGYTRMHQNHRVEIGAEMLAREIIMPKCNMPGYAEMEHSIASARKIAAENSIPVSSVLARLTYDTNTWSDVGFGIYTTYCNQDSCRLFITSPYPVDDSYYTRKNETGYIGSSFSMANAAAFKFPKSIQTGAGGAVYMRLSRKDASLNETADWLMHSVMRNFQSIAAGTDRSAVAAGVMATAGFERSKSNVRNVSRMPVELRLGNTLIMLSRSV